ncbi:hypothetical protein BDU57DRAFT_155474 [Ampelomyces quisqualis]|uniref:EthD domain-containing protein n=1 Tax=Ampelomyces quisqualis TaxID=50730 RepID=A0A6A5QZ95_AMPQU|nr:hypothetical protein BDU57DRAFT_155474 [Ampelomyces quisqualis]
MTSTQKIAAVVAYPAKHPESGEPLAFDMEYYLASHMPMIEKAWGPYGLKSWSINTFADPCPLTGEKPPYLVQTTCYFDSVEDLRMAMRKGSEETRSDVEKFSNVFPVLWVGERRGRNVLEGENEGTAQA